MMSSCVSTENLSDWSAADADDHEFLDNTSRCAGLYKDLTWRQNADLKDSIKKNRDEIRRLRKQNKRLRAIRGKKPNYHNRNHRSEINHTDMHDDPYSPHEDDDNISLECVDNDDDNVDDVDDVYCPPNEVEWPAVRLESDRQRRQYKDADYETADVLRYALSLVLCLLMGIILGYGSATPRTDNTSYVGSPNIFFSVKMNRWMELERQGMLDLQLNWTRANMQLFERILELETVAGLRNVRNKIRSLEDFYFNVSKTVQECVVANIRKIEEYLKENANDIDLPIDKEEKVDKATARWEEEVLVQDKRETGKDTGSEEKMKDAAKTRQTTASERKEEKEKVKEKNKVASECEDGLRLLVNKALNGVTMKGDIHDIYIKEREIERAAKARYGGTFFVLINLKGMERDVYIDHKREGKKSTSTFFFLNV